MNRVRDAEERRAKQFAALQMSFEKGTLSTKLEKFLPNILFVRAELDGKPIKVARGSKPKILEGLAPGTLVVTVERPLYGTRHSATCEGYLGAGEQEVLIFPEGDSGIGCRFRFTETVAIAAAPAASDEVLREAIPEWELRLPFEQFAAVGDCLDDHERGTEGFHSCIDAAGVTDPTDA